MRTERWRTVSGDYEIGKPAFGFLFPAFKARGARTDAIQIYHEDPQRVEEDILHLLGVERS